MTERRGQVAADYWDTVREIEAASLDHEAPDFVAVNERIRETADDGLMAAVQARLSQLQALQPAPLAPLPVGAPLPNLTGTRPSTMIADDLSPLPTWASLPSLSLAQAHVNAQAQAKAYAHAHAQAHAEYQHLLAMSQASGVGIGQFDPVRLTGVKNILGKR